MSTLTRSPQWSLLLVFAVGCVTPSSSSSLAETMDVARGPWSEVPTMELSTRDASVPIGLIRDVADALLKRPGARSCDPESRRPFMGLSTEYCATIYVAGPQDALSWRVSEPVTGSHRRCVPFSAVRDADYPESQVWVVGYVHNHPCGSPPSSGDLGSWPTDAFNPYVAMAEVRLIPGNPLPALAHGKAIEMASVVVAERADGQRIYLRYFPTGELEQWSHARNGWVVLGRCAPAGRDSINQNPRCAPAPLRLLWE